MLKIKCDRDGLPSMSYNLWFEVDRHKHHPVSGKVLVKTVDMQHNAIRTAAEELALDLLVKGSKCSMPVLELRPTSEELPDELAPEYTTFSETEQCGDDAIDDKNGTEIQPEALPPAIEKGEDSIIAAPYDIPLISVVLT